MAKNELLDERLTYSVIGAFYEVYNALGFGFLESIYKTALERELRARGQWWWLQTVVAAIELL